MLGDADATPMAQGIGQQRHTRAGQSETCIEPRCRSWGRGAVREEEWQWLSSRSKGCTGSTTCAKKLSDGMGGNPPGLYQGAHEPLGLSRVGRSIPVRSMPLKGTGEPRGKPARGLAWLSTRMVSSHEADFNLRGIQPRTQDFA
jgi:hypothetical protein